MSAGSFVAALTRIPIRPKEVFDAIPKTVEWIEVRSDLTGDIDPRTLRSWTDRKLIYRLRPCGPNGKAICAEDERIKRLRRAANDYDLVELQADLDLNSRILDAIVPHKRIICAVPDGLEANQIAACIKELTMIPARFYKFCIPIEYSHQALALMLLLKDLKRDDLIIIGLGPKGVWTRLIGYHFGAPILFCRLEAEGIIEDPDGEPTLSQMIEEYCLPRARMPVELFGIVGGRAVSSLSPKVHNAGYVMLGRNALFLPFPEPDYMQFWNSLVGQERGTKALGLPLVGLTVVSPHKLTGLNVLDASSDIVQRAKSHNLVLRNRQRWIGESTDPVGVMACLNYRGIQPATRHVAIIGCGGAGRAIAVALNAAGARVSLFNRTEQNGLLAAELVGLPYFPLSKFSAESFDLVINTTPVGVEGCEAPFDLAQLHHGMKLIDLAYGVSPTPLVNEAKTIGISVCDGREVLWWQVRHQFRKMTGQTLPNAVGQQIFGIQGPWGVFQDDGFGRKML